MLTAREFQPELMSRRGELLAWLAGLGLILSFLLGSDAWGPMPIMYWAFAIFIVFSAMSISLGNWMDRRSLIRLDSAGIAFENGLRSVRLTWPEVQNVAVVQSRSGKRVQIQGALTHFTFKTMSESTFGKYVMRTGFAAGQEILEAVLSESGLQLKAEKDGITYYTRV
jgi:hypothetical protein